MSRINRLNVAGALITGLLVFLAAPCTQAATLVWTGGVDNVWNTSTTNWLNGGVAASYTDGDDVVFDSSARITTNINIAGTFSPHSIVFSNSNTKTYSFTNGVLTGTGGILKTNNGTVYFGVIGTADTDITYPISSMLFSGGTVIYQGAIRFGVNTNNGSVFDFASGGWPVAFGTGPITLNGSTAEFRCSQRSGLSVATVLTNDFTIGANGGKIDVSKANVSGTGGSPQHNICGNINQYGNLYYATGNGAGGLSNTFSRILTGVTRVYSSCTTTVEGAGTFGWARVAYEQNMTNMIPGAVLTLIGGNQNGMIEVTGDNRGLTGGIILRSHATAPNPVIFTGTNAMGGANLTVATNAYAGLAFDFTPSLLSSMIFEDGAVLGIDSNSSVNINLSAGGLNKDIWLGTSRGATYTGTLTPAGNAYKLCGGGVNANLLPLLLSNTNALTGDCYLFAGNTNSYQPPGMVILAASNSYTLGTIISGSKRADPTVVARSAGSLGTGPILINRISGSASGAGPTLQIEVPYRVLTADLTITGQVGHATLNTVGPLILQNNLTLYGTNSLNIMGNNGINSAIIFNQAASGKAVTMGANSRIN